MINPNEICLPLGPGDDETNTISGLRAISSKSTSKELAGDGRGKVFLEGAQEQDVCVNKRAIRATYTHGVECVRIFKVCHALRPWGFSLIISDTTRVSYDLFKGMYCDLIRTYKGYRLSYDGDDSFLTAAAAALRFDQVSKPMQLKS
jgi:hypothetical protein